MAELVLKIGNDASPDRYKDGDIICAFNQRRIRACHADVICHVKHVPFNSDGLNPIDSLPIHWFENTHQFKFERVSAKEIKRTNLLTLEEDIISNVPNAKGEAMDVERFIQRRLSHPRHRIFGTKNHEVWFGGNIDKSDARLDKVWEKIEELTPNREVNFKLWPLSPTEKRHFLALPVDDFDDEERDEYESMETDEEGQVIQKRLHRIDYASLVTARKLQDIQDKTIEVDLRSEVTPFTRTNVISTKERTR